MSVRPSISHQIVISSLKQSYHLTIMRIDYRIDYRTNYRIDYRIDYRIVHRIDYRIDYRIDHVSIYSM